MHGALAEVAGARTARLSRGTTLRRSAPVLSRSQAADAYRASPALCGAPPDSRRAAPDWNASAATVRLRPS